jgi:hypothetical protein
VLNGTDPRRVINVVMITSVMVGLTRSEARRMACLLLGNISPAGPQTVRFLNSEILQLVHPIRRLLVWMGTRNVVRPAQQCDQQTHNLMWLEIDGKQQAPIRTYIFNASTAFLATSSPTHSASTLASCTSSSVPTLPTCGFAVSPGRN